MDGLLLIDKKEGLTSYDIIKLVKRLYHTKKVGHCGTLDPFASGLLIIGVNQATKVMNYLEHDYKVYETTIKLGSSTDTYDLTGKVVSESSINKVTKEEILNVLNSFKGEITQVPPIYSSIHIDGKHLYEYARNNEEVEIPSRKVTIFELELLDFGDDFIKVYVKCSRGTYIRSLGYDIAKALNNDGHLTYLRRISIGNLSVNDANSYDDLVNQTVNLKKVDEVISFNCIEVTTNQLIRVYNGQPFEINDCNYDRIFIKDNNEVVAIYAKHDDGLYYCDRGLFNEEIRFSRLKELQG